MFVRRSYAHGVCPVPPSETVIQVSEVNTSGKNEMTSDVKVDNGNGSLLFCLPVGRNVDDCAFEGRNIRLTPKPLRSNPDKIDPIEHYPSLDVLELIAALEWVVDSP